MIPRVLLGGKQRNHKVGILKCCMFCGHKPSVVCIVLLCELCSEIISIFEFCPVALAPLCTVLIFSPDNPKTARCYDLHEVPQPFNHVTSHVQLLLLPSLLTPF